MINRFAELEQKALRLKNAGRIAEAAELLSVIVEAQPNWAHGGVLHNLAQCYEDLGRYELAENLYRAALDYEPINDIFLGGLASFLYLHGKPEDAFDAHVKLLTIQRSQGSEVGIESIMVVLNALGERMGWSRAMIVERFEKGMA